MKAGFFYGTKMVTNEEYTAAYHNEDNIKIIKKAVKKYARSIDPHDLQAIKDKALWKALDKYDTTKGKFTTWLYSYITYLCRAHIYSRKKSKKIVLISNYDKDNQHPTEYNRRMEELIECLSEEDQKLIKYKFVDKMTLSEIGELYDCTDENIRLKLKKIYEILKNQNDS